MYRAEPGASSLFGPGPSLEPVRKVRKPIDSFTINEPDVDRARRIAIEIVERRHREKPDSVSVLVDGGISVLLRANS